MKTTELFVEQVLIGLLVILIGGLVFFNQIKAFYEQHQSSPGLLAQIVAGGFLIGGAYLIGMVYDRIADTLLQDLESYGRLHFALKPLRIKVGEFADKFFTPHCDPFEDGKYRILVLGNSQATDHMEYLRSRIRLTRALTTLVPAILVSLLLFQDDGRAGRWWYAAAVALPLIYAATLFTKGMDFKRIKARRPPKTYELKKVMDYMIRGRLLFGTRGAPHSVSWFILQDEVWLALFFLVVVAVTLTHGPYGWFLVVAAVASTLIAGWSWWRISNTFYSFLRDYQRFGSR